MHIFCKLKTTIDRLNAILNASNGRDICIITGYYIEIGGDMASATGTSSRNYTVEFFRFMFAINFILLHVTIIGATRMGGAPVFANGFDVIIPFMAFSGFFLMGHFKKLQRAGRTEGITPTRQAWDYLKARLFALLPLTFVVTLACIVVNCIWFGIPPIGGVMYALNAVTELFGLQILGMYGNAVMGSAVEKGISAITTAGPLWFISGIFVIGYVVYYLVAKYDEHFTGWIAPAFIGLFYGSCYLMDFNPMWNSFLTVGDFAVSTGLLNMFCGMSLGVLLWVAVDNLKGKTWSGGAKVVFSIVQLLCVALVFFKSWVSTASPLGVAFNIGWGAMFFYTTVFSFFTLLNVDYVTRCPIFSSKIWRIPGRLALYIYMIHYPLMTAVMLAMGMHPGAAFDPSSLYVVFGITTGVSVVLSYIVMKFEDKVLKPWIASKPWYTREQAAQELEAAKAAK